MDAGVAAGARKLEKTECRKISPLETALGSSGEQVEVFLPRGHRMDDHLATTLEGEYDRLQETSLGIETQSQLTSRRAVVKGLIPQRPLGHLRRVLRGDAMPEGAGVDLHAAK